MDKEPTLGEFRVGVNFNPSKESIVDEIKVAAAVLIDLIDNIPPYPKKDYSDGERRNGHLKTKAMNERNALREIAQRKVEEAAMWAVKAATKQ